MSEKKEWLFIELDQDLTEAQCAGICDTIQSMEGVELAGFAPEGCFGRNAHRLNVLFNQNSRTREAITKMPGVQNITSSIAGYPQPD